MWNVMFGRGVGVGGRGFGVDRDEQASVNRNHSKLIIHRITSAYLLKFLVSVTSNVPAKLLPLKIFPRRFHPRYTVKFTVKRLRFQSSHCPLRKSRWRTNESTARKLRTRWRQICTIKLCNDQKPTIVYPIIGHKGETNCRIAALEIPSASRFGKHKGWSGILEPA